MVKQCTEVISEHDIIVMNKVKEITERGNNAEVKRRKDGTLTVFEVRKKVAV